MILLPKAENVHFSTSQSRVRPIGRSPSTVRLGDRGGSPTAVRRLAGLVRTKSAERSIRWTAKKRVRTCTRDREIFRRQSNRAARVGTYVIRWLVNGNGAVLWRMPRSWIFIWYYYIRFRSICLKVTSSVPGRPIAYGLDTVLNNSRGSESRVF